MIFTFNQVALLFFIYSFLGWCIEVAFVAVTLGEVTNRGFLHGPVCPIYGCGMLGVLMILTPIEDNIFMLFIGGMLICSAVELFGGWILDKIFHMRWWDYSNKKFNVGGYICLAFSIMWGMAVVFAVKFVHPPIMSLIKKIPVGMQFAIIIVLSVIIIVDMIVTLKNLIGMKKSLGQLDKMAEELQGIGDQLKDIVGNSAITVAEKAGEGKEIWDEKTAVSREMIVSATEAGKEIIAAATENSREKIASATEEQREKFAAQKKELENKMDAMIESLQKKTKQRFNTLPTLNKYGRSINIKEYIKELKNKIKNND